MQKKQQLRHYAPALNIYSISLIAYQNNYLPHGNSSIAKEDITDGKNIYHEDISLQSLSTNITETEGLAE